MIAEKAADLVRAHWHARSQGFEPDEFVQHHVLHPHRRNGQLFDFRSVQAEFSQAVERVGGEGGREEEDITRGWGGERVDGSRTARLQSGRLFGDWNATVLSGKRVARQGSSGARRDKSLKGGVLFSMDRGHSDDGVTGGELNGKLNSELNGELSDEFRDELSADGAWPVESELLRYSDESHPTDRADMMETAREKLSRLVRALSSSETVL